ncbi:MAG: endonuclease [Candidatus Micrarchaeota archaeon]|nr:endonuclease [Candidatus Micrarchaeota archaeon]
MRLEGLYGRLRKRFGYLDWWPGETRDEIVIGAMLTQQTSWSNVEKAIASLKEADSLDFGKISSMNLKRLERLIRPSGFYRQKARRLKAFASYVCGNYGSTVAMFRKDADSLREELLSLDGIGPETADSIILYAAGNPTFVVDAYTRRIISRIYGTEPDMDYDNLKTLITANIKHDIELYSDFHAQFVELGKRHCRTRPICGNCPAAGICRYNRMTNP